MKHKAKLTISRPSYGDGRRKMSIRIKDVASNIQFVELQVDLDKFTEALTGLGETECDMDVRNLQNVGKKIESMKIEFELPRAHWSMDKEEIISLGEKNTPSGWKCSSYYGSQSSFFGGDGEYFARTSATRWVEK